MLKPLLTVAALVAAIVMGKLLNRLRRAQAPAFSDTSGESREEARPYDTDDSLMP